MAKRKGSDKPRKWPETALSRLIARRIDEMGITQADLADRLHVHASYISQLVAGRRPDMDAPGFIGRYAAALELSEEVFIAEGELWRYNIVPPGPSDISPARRFLLAVTDHLSDEAVERLARGVREQYGGPPPALPPPQPSQEPG